MAHPVEMVESDKPRLGWNIGSRPEGVGADIAAGMPRAEMAVGMAYTLVGTAEAAAERIAPV